MNYQKGTSRSLWLCDLNWIPVKSPFDTWLCPEAADGWASGRWRGSSLWSLRRSGRWSSSERRWRQRTRSRLVGRSPWRRTWPLWPKWRKPVCRTRAGPDVPPTCRVKLRGVWRCGETEPARASSRTLRTSGSRRTPCLSRRWYWELRPRIEHNNSSYSSMVELAKWS